MPRIVFRGCSVEDPTADGYFELTIDFKEFAPAPKFLGKNTMRGSGRIRGRTQFRREINGECIPFSREVVAGQTQNYAVMDQLLEVLLAQPYIYVWRCYEGFGTADVLRRADYDRSNPTSTTYTNSYWHASAATDDGYPYDPPGNLPMLVVPADGEVKPSYAGGGLYEIDLALLAADPS